MLRNQNNDFAGFGQEYPGFHPPIQTPPPAQLDATAERLLELSQRVGTLEGQNDLLNEDNRRLEQENEKYRRENATLEGRNRELEQRESAAQAGFRSASELMDEFEQVLSNRKVTKEKK